jgi:hypothetical protein
MAQLWVSDRGDWCVVLLDREELMLASVAEAAGGAPGWVGRGPSVIRTGGPERGTWALVESGATGVRVNGLRLLGGLRALRDRDEVLVPGLGRLFFSTERAAKIESMPVAEREVCCPRCKQPIVTGGSAVRCPGCGLWHHEADTLSCWSYESQCAHCGRATSFDAGFAWSPEMAES